MSKKRLSLIIILLGLLISIACFSLAFEIGRKWFSREKNILKEEKEEVKGERIEKLDQVDLSLDFGEGKVSTYSLSIDDSPTVLELLNRLAEENNLNLVTKDYDFGILIEEIGEVKNNQENFWLYFVNGKLGEVSADKYELKKGDRIEWKYEKIKK